MSLFWPNYTMSRDQLDKSKTKKEFHKINTSLCSQVVHNKGIFLWHYFKKGSVDFFLTHIFWTLRSQRSLICGICHYDKTHILNLAKRRCALWKKVKIFGQILCCVRAHCAHPVSIFDVIRTWAHSSIKNLLLLEFPHFLLQLLISVVLVIFLSLLAIHILLMTDFIYPID